MNILRAMLPMTLSLVLMFGAAFAEAQVTNEDASVSVFFSPRSATYTVGTEFLLPVYINTNGNGVKEVAINIFYDPEMVAVVRPSGGKSIFEEWAEAPTYDNEKGVISMKGRIPKGITTESGLITSIAFSARATGDAVFTMGDDAVVHLDDAQVTTLTPLRDRAVYTIAPKAAEGVVVFSETHPSSNTWYNNNSPVFSWAGDPSVADYSYVLDDKPATIPDNGADTNETTASFENIDDGLWYFHIKPRKKDVWYGTTHYLVKIDTKPPAPFNPTVESLSSREGNRAVISFRAADSLSGMSRYEVGVVDANAPVSEKPVYVQTDSPYALSHTASEKVRVIVRAFDRAGNVEEGAITIDRTTGAGILLASYAMPLLAVCTVLLLIFVIFHFFVGHHVLRRVRHAMGPLEEYRDMRDVAYREQVPAPHTPIVSRKIAAISLEDIAAKAQRPVLAPIARLEPPPTAPAPIPAPMTSFVHPPHAHTTSRMDEGKKLAPVPAPLSVSVTASAPTSSPIEKTLASAPTEMRHMVVEPQEYLSYVPPPPPAAEILSAGEPVIETVTVQPPAAQPDAPTPTYTLNRPKNPPTKLPAMMVMPRAKPTPAVSTPPVYSAHEHFPDPVLPKHVMP